MPARREIHRHAREARPVLQHLPAMRHPPVVALLARRIDRRVHGIEYAADEDRAVARGSAGPFEHRRQVAEGKAGPGRGQIEEEFDAGGHRITPFPSPRSEEHTSELQSLMRTSYAV